MQDRGLVCIRKVSVRNERFSPSWHAACSFLLQRGRWGVLWTIVAILMILWLLGVLSAYTLGGFVYPMLVVERVVLFIDLVTGRRSARGGANFR
jgi:hypothetical protein